MSTGTEVDLHNYNQKGESFLSKLRGKLFSDADDGERVYDLEGNVVGNITDDGLVVEGQIVKKKVFFDEEV
jgi:hypothetical protein